MTAATLSSPRSSSTEINLIRRVLDGDCEAFYELVHPYERLAFLAALALLKNDGDAEEVAQEGILKAFKNLARFRLESRFSTWLTQIVINEAKLRLRKDRRHLYESLADGIVNEQGEHIPREIADWREIPSQALENRELRDQLRQSLDVLPAKYRAVLVLRDIQDRSIRETAELLGLSEANVKTRLCRARQQMRDAFVATFSMRGTLALGIRCL